MKKFCCLVFLLNVASGAVVAPARGATLSNVPMQGTMVMPMIRYEAAAGRLHVQLDPADVRLTPLLVSHPADSFDPGDPWFEFLDPARQGLAFSRRYGFVMDAATDPLPPGLAIWIRKLSSSPGLDIYRYRSSEPKSWQPIFGTAGSPDALAWNGMMFHPGFTAPPGTGACVAKFEAVLIDAGAGLEIPGSSTGPFELTWTSLADGRPVLSIAYKVVITCPETTGYALEVTDTLSPAGWRAVTNAPVLIEGQSAVVLDAGAARKFYRMQRLP